MFVGRNNELTLLTKLKQKKTSSLVCILGRRRIGKSTLVEQFSKSFKSFYSIQGLAPAQGLTNQDQLNHFSGRMASFFKKDKILFESWTEAFFKLAEYTQKGEFLIFFDEISWMGRQDPAFASALKEAWDEKFKKNPKIILILCGSVSTWIEDNILKNMSFEGRISLEINLQELSLPELNQFWTKKHYKISSFEKMMILSVTGGVPKYMEEVLESETAEKNLMRLCFTKEGFLFNDFSKIFTDIFERKSPALEKIIRTCLLEKLSPAEVAKKIGRSQNKEFTDHIHILEIAGFLSRDYCYKPDGEISKLSYLRVKDNYLRFYIKQIEPLRDQIIRAGKTLKTYKDIKGIESLFGYQFENLILANRQLLNFHLDIENNEILFSSPYQQRKTALNKGACQIDLLVGTHFNTFYLCEFKCQKWIDKTIIDEVQRKCDVIQLPRRSSVRPVLVYEGEIFPPHKNLIEDYFFRMIRFEDLLTNS